VTGGDVTPAELQAILLARDFRPDDRVIQVGANLPAARAAAMMANLSTHPDARILLGVEVENLSGGRPIPPVHPFLFHALGYEMGEANMHQALVFDDMARPDVFFVGGLQVDRVGNVNLVGLPGENGGWRLRGPGAVALATMSTYCRGYYILMPRHDPNTFVERVSSITALGDRARRAELGFPGGGPRLLLSPLGVFDFDDSGSMRLRSVHEGVSVDQVVEATGFELVLPDDVPSTPPATEAELELLRSRVDSEGLLRDR
jgi:glutaconate CoA-transferase subunit B